MKLPRWKRLTELGNLANSPHANQYQIVQPTISPSAKGCEEQDHGYAIQRLRRPENQEKKKLKQNIQKF
jgi:hypothetical protein